MNSAIEPVEKGFVSQSVSFPADLLERAKEKARNDRRSLSNYFQVLVARDLDAEAAQVEEVRREQLPD